MSNHNQKRHVSQFFTPEVVVQFMFDLVGFNPLWKVADPACGDGTVWHFGCNNPMAFE
jgi:type I restriction-modification system DNA methylase subunit